MAFIILSTAGHRAEAQPCTIPFIFQNYTPGGPLQIIDANELNADFVAVADCASGVGFVTSILTAAGVTFVLPATPLVLYVLRQPSSFVVTAQLPANPIANFQACIKDGGNNFSANPITVKTTDGSQIDGIAGSTGITMQQNRQSDCFIFDGTVWDIY